MVYRIIAPEWLTTRHPDYPKTYEGRFTHERVVELNCAGYNCYYFVNSPSQFQGGHVGGADIDTFSYVFLDMDLKDYQSADPDRFHPYPDKKTFIDILKSCPLPPTQIVDSGGGIHAYWRVTDLDAMSYLKLQRRLARHFKTDKHVSKICQLMRVPGTVNAKDEQNFTMCEIAHVYDRAYTCEELDQFLPSILRKDLEYCDRHYAHTYSPGTLESAIRDEIPLKFAHLLRENSEIKTLWLGETGDRSKADYRLGHIMHSHGFTKDEALSVLVNSKKALERAPVHRLSYAENIVDKIYTQVTEKPQSSGGKKSLSSNVRKILEKGTADTRLGERITCHPLVDATENGFRLGEVMGLVGGSGAGKTTFALNLFRWFVQNNPNFVHVFVTLEQPESEIARRWQTMCGDNTHLYDRVEVIGNYEEDGSYRHLSLAEIKADLLAFQERTGQKIGCVVVDHIGVLKHQARDEKQGLMEICNQLKSFAVQTNTFLIMQSQTSREKAGIGDLELNKDAAYGTTFFEWWVDLLVTIWQPLKRVYDEASDMTCIAYKFCKIRKKNVRKDKIKEDVRYKVMFDPSSEVVRELTAIEEKRFDFLNTKATNLRKQDRKTDVLAYKATDWVTGEHEHREVISPQNP